MKILFLTPQLPFPPESGGLIKTFQTLKLLAKRHEVFLVCFTSSSLKAGFKKQLEDICQRAEVVVSPYPTAQFKDMKPFILKSLFSPMPFIVFRHHDKKMKDLVKRLIKKEKFDAIHIDHLNIASCLPKKKDCLWVLEEHNIESEINWGIFKREKWNKFKIFSFWEALKLTTYEKRVIPKFDYIFTISEEDKKKLVKLGVKKDKVFFLPTPFKTKNLFSFKRNLPVILFVGMLSWWPNKDGFFWFYQKVLPLIKQAIPGGVRFIVVGKGAAEEMVALNKKDPSFELVGYAKYLTKYLAKAGVFVVPLRAGSGIRIKILTALSAGLPVVSTTKGAEGVTRKTEGGIILADTPGEFAKAVVRIIKDKNFAKELSHEGIEFIKKNYNRQKAKEVLRKVYV